MAVRKTFTPELIANGRRRYEETDEPLTSIAADFGVHVRTLRDYMRQWDWTPRSRRPPVGLSPLAGLLEESKEIPPPSAPAAAGGGGADAAAPDAAVQDASAAQAPPPSGPAPAAPEAWAERRAAMVERLSSAIEAELGAVERLRAQLGAQPLSPADSERTARALETIMRTLREVDRLRFTPAALAAAEEADDLPRDLDEFRRALAERIEAFVRSRTEPAVSGAGSSDDGGPAR